MKRDISEDEWIGSEPWIEGPHVVWLLDVEKRARFGQWIVVKSENPVVLLLSLLDEDKLDIAATAEPWEEGALNCNVYDLEIWEIVLFGQFLSFTSQDWRELQVTPNGLKFEMKGYGVLENSHMTYEYFWSEFNLLKIVLELGRNNAILHRKLWSNSPKGEGKIGFPTQVRPSQLCEQSILIFIRHNGILLHMFIIYAN